MPVFCCTATGALAPRANLSPSVRQIEHTLDHVETAGSHAPRAIVVSRPLQHGEVPHRSRRRTQVVVAHSAVLLRLPFDGCKGKGKPEHGEIS